MKGRASLVSWLVFHAQRERDLVRLAMAFKVQKPHWGSHATLVAAGLSSYVQFLDWHLQHTEARFREWLDVAKGTHSEAQLRLRTAQIKELADLVVRPRSVAMPAAAADDHRTPAALLLPRLANRGLLYRDVQVLAGEGLRSPLSERILPGLSRSEADLYNSRHAELRHVTPHDYLQAVIDGARPRHPDVLLRDVLEHWSVLARLGSYERPLLEHAAATRRGVEDYGMADDDRGPSFRGPALDA
ncbi:MAG: hypothetical protein H0U69_10915 [Trueperaceae bacterium]|nr:hypothetical protein [Trueperaceae bacterium]